MGREFISPNETFAEADSILAESADHSTGIDHGHYAVVHGAVPRLSNNTMFKQRWLGSQWSRLLGFGPLPPQEPVRLSHLLPGAHGGDFQSLKSFFTNEVKEELVQAVICAVQEQFRLARGPAAMPQSPLASGYDVPEFNSKSTLADLFDDDDESMGPRQPPSDSPLPASSIPSPSYSLSSDLLPPWDAVPARPQRGNVNSSKPKVRADPPIV